MSVHRPTSDIKVIIGELIRGICFPINSLGSLRMKESDVLSLPVRLRQMPAKLLRFPSRALKVKVAGFKSPSVNKDGDVLPYSPGWSVKAAMEMIDMLHGHITASVVTQDPELTVLLYNEKEELVHLPLVSSGLAEFE